LQALYKLG